MDRAWPYLIAILVLGGLLLVSLRNQRRRAAARADEAATIGPGTSVMTTSGLYGTVSAQNGDGSVQLLIAPGVEVRWAVAALRSVDRLPAAYRSAFDPEPQDVDGPPSGDRTGDRRGPSRDATPPPEGGSDR